MLLLRVRSDSFRYVLHQGRSWDDIYIGFQGRFCVTPDIYHFKFLNHFSNLLPDYKPNLQLIETHERLCIPLYFMAPILVILLAIFLQISIKTEKLFSEQ